MKYKLNKIFIKVMICLLILNFMLISSNTFADDIDYENELETSSLEVENKSKTEENLKLNSRSCVILDRTSSKVLYGKNEYNKVKMASTTKIMTAIIVIENYDLNKTIEVSKKAANTGGSRLGLKTGDKITINDLLYGLMLRSGNDAAVCLAECTAGSVANFAVLMNNKASELGLNNSHFESPHGLDSDNHYTTAYELAKLSNYALRNKTFAKIVGTKTYTVTINGSPKTLSNTNELLGNLNGVYGIKTGFTNGANRCLVTACKRGNMDIICVVLGADTKKFRTQDSVKLIEYAFNNFEYVDIENIVNSQFETWKSKNMSTFSINKKSFTSNFDISLSKLDSYTFPVNKSESNNIKTLVNVEKNLDAPIKKGNIIGSINVYTESSNLVTIPIIVNDDINRNNLSNYLYYFFKNYNSITFNAFSNI